MSMVDGNGQVADRWYPDSIITTVARAAERLRLSEKMARRHARRARLDTRAVRATRIAEQRGERPDIRDILAASQPGAEDGGRDDEKARADASALASVLGMLDERDKRIQMLETERAELHRAAGYFEAQLKIANQWISYLQATRSRTSDPPPRPFLAF